VSCLRELKKLQTDVLRAPESEYRRGCLDILREVLEIVEEHEDEGE